MYRTRALEAYLDYWISQDPAEKRRLLDESWRLAKIALVRFQASKNNIAYAETYYILSQAVAIGVFYYDNVKDRVRATTEAVEYGRKAVAMFRRAGSREQLARTLTRTSLFLDSLADRCSDPDKIRIYQREALSLWEEALRTSNDEAIRETSHPPDGFYRILDQIQNHKFARKALELVTAEHDNFSMGWILNRLAHYTFWQADASEAPTTIHKLHDRALRYAEESAIHYSRIDFTSPIAGVLWAHSPYAEYFLYNGMIEEIPEKARFFLEKSVRTSPELLRLARLSLYPDIIHYALHVKSKAETNLAAMETNRFRSKRLLHSALRERSESAELAYSIETKVNWNVGLAFSNLAMVQVKLAELEKEPENRKQLLLQAVANKEKGIGCNTKFLGLLARPERHVLRGPLGNGNRELGDFLTQLYRTTKDQTCLRKAAAAYEKSSYWFASIPRYEKLAQSHWKAAEAYDLLQLHSLAAENFDKASAAYTQLGKKVPELKDFSNSYSHYMKAWSEIEQARSSHVKLDFSQAAEHYAKAARLHANTARWRFIADYYFAWSSFEYGESLSKDGRREQAASVFQAAASMFAQSRVSIKKRFPILDRPDEAQMIEGLGESTRDVYCNARALIEEAVLAEDRGDHRASSEKFAVAAGHLREASKGESQEAKEIRFLSILCNAWQLSSRAEFENSTELLAEAQKLFEKAVRADASREALELAAGHNAFCKALIASETFARTLRQAAYEEASREFDTAAQRYLELGFKTACYYAIARKLFIDASLEISLSNSDKDQRKKREHYRLALGLLRESARMFRKARQPEKSAQTLRLLRKVGIESRIADHLSEILDAASDKPTNVVFQTPAQGNERAVGLDRLQTVHLDSSVSAQSKRVGEDTFIEAMIEILNVGDGPVKILRLEDAIPEQAELTEISVKAKAQGRTLVLDNTQISPKNMETIRVLMKTNAEDFVSLQPRILFSDKAKIERKQIVEPWILPTSSIIQFLAKSFVRDYAERRLPADNCGWRTLMDIVKALKIPRSHLYGEPRYGRPFGRQLEQLLKASFVEYRIFPGERGRGGEITKARLRLENQLVNGFIRQSIDLKNDKTSLLISPPSAELTVQPAPTIAS